MRPSMEQIHYRVPADGARRAGQAPSGGILAPAAGRVEGILSLPAFARDIPTRIVPASGQQLAAHVAQFLIDAGAVSARTWPAGCDDMLEGCSIALNTWLAKHVGQLHCFSPRFVLEPVAREDMPESLHAERGGGAQDSVGIQIVWTESAVCHWSVGAGLDYLEEAAPRLGATVLEVMERKGWHAYPLFTPRLALDEASYLYWCGEDDETIMLEECGNDLDAREAMRRDMVTRADIDAAFPAWALLARADCRPPRQLATLAAQHTCPYVRHAAALARDLLATATSALYSADSEVPFTGFGAVLCWRENDLAVRISDDYAQLAWQDAYCDLIGRVVFALDAPHALRRWLRDMQSQLRAIGLLDRLLWHLTARE
ncbi:PRTRC system protein F [Massilia sp. BJB1822]|uniref:PRTRC system protein F n=1 Tax=Massilia sp. BJB1822 TaxID=2744470 RepID=UPI001593C151|nr:PRTRC system protein F [Massilia sp. BJB1822]NVE00679.1 PRTRC system protein F [Massilia sp. BJB1822]